MCAAQSGIEIYIESLLQILSKCSIFPPVQAYAFELVKLGMVPEDQLSLLQSSALFYWFKRKERKPWTILLSSLCFSICKSGGKASLDHVQAIRVERASPVALSDFGHALLTHPISWESICACSSREDGHKLNWVTCSEMVSFSTDGPRDAWWNC